MATTFFVSRRQLKKDVSPEMYNNAVRAVQIAANRGKWVTVREVETSNGWKVQAIYTIPAGSPRVTDFFYTPAKSWLKWLKSGGR